MSSVLELCLRQTLLSIEEAQVLDQLAQHLQYIADVSESDAFIDCPLEDVESALVVAQAHPNTAPSLYRTSVVGQRAQSSNEPAVLFCLISGKPVTGSRGISQEQIAIQQNVIPIRVQSGKVIAALILEQDITARVEQEKNVERLKETNEQLSETLLSLAMSELKAKEKQLNMKSAAIKEIHHRVKNNLQTVSGLLRLQMRRTKFPEVEKVFRDSIHRINSIAVIHEMLAYDGTDNILFNDVAERIAKNIVSSSAKPDQWIRIQLAGDELVLPSYMATTLALVVNELVQNCAAHAFVNQQQGDIKLLFKSDAHVVHMRVQDNGCGMKALNGNTDKKGSIGLKITETLVKESLGGVIQIHSDKEGTEVVISIPLQAILESSESGGLL